MDMSIDWECQIAKVIIEKYKGYYKELEENENVVLDVLKTEKMNFIRTLEKGLKEFAKATKDQKDIDGYSTTY